MRADALRCLGHEVVLEDFGRVRRCLTCERAALARPDAVIELTTGIYKVRFGDPAPEPRGTPVEIRDPPTNCPNCGAPHEPGRCSYCLTPSR